MTGVQILVLVVALLAVVAVVTAAWIHRRRTGGVLIADAAKATSDTGDRR
jgi:hypothetical protein